MSWQEAYQSGRRSGEVRSMPPCTPNHRWRVERRMPLPQAGGIRPERKRRV